MTILDPDVASASASLVAAHKRVVKEKNRQINALQAEKGELQRALQERPARTGEALSMAALWKETARHISRDARETIAALVARQMDENRRIHGARREAIARAEKAEQERDEARANAYNWEATAEEWEKRALAAAPRTLTPDAITDEMRKRAREAFFNEWDRADSTLSSVIDAALTAALTEPPARPEGAEEIERLLTEDLGDFRPPVEPEAIADLLAVRGVRVITEDGAR